MDCNHPPRDKTKFRREEKHKCTYECAFRKSWSENKLWLNTLKKKTNSMHCVKGHEAAEVDESFKPKNCIIIAGTDKLKSDSVEYNITSQLS